VLPIQTRRPEMTTEKKRCMVCGKPFEDIQSICKSCEESIRGEAVGKRKRAENGADKELRQHGQAPPQGGEKK
jgi:predicted amidophosphoribosyltransferase